MIEKHPVLAGIMGALLLKAVMPKNSAGAKMHAAGNFTVADPTRGFYNTDWQRRFREMQSRPVAVIKTGAAENLAETLVSPLTYLIMSVDLAKTAEEQRVWNGIAERFLESIPQNSKDWTALNKLEKEASVSALAHFPGAADFDIIRKLFGR